MISGMFGKLVCRVIFIEHHLTFVESVVTAKDGELYLCGVFQKHSRKRQHRADSHTDISNVGLSKGDSHISEDIGMDLDMTGGKYTKGKNCEIGMKLDATEVKKMETSKPKEAGKIFDMTADKQTERVKCKKSGIKLELTGEQETNRVNKCLPMLKTLDANAVLSNAAPTVSFFTGSCSPDSAGNNLFFFCLGGISCYFSDAAPVFAFADSCFFVVFSRDYRFSM